MDREARQAMKAAKRVNAKIYDLLKGKAPGLQGAILADLLATWLVGFPEQLRDGLLQMHVDAVRDMIPVNESILHGEGGHPGNAKSIM
jgi:hypothetical protein